MSLVLCFGTDMLLSREPRRTQNAPTEEYATRKKEYASASPQTTIFLRVAMGEKICVSYWKRDHGRLWWLYTRCRDIYKRHETAVVPDSLLLLGRRSCASTRQPAQARVVRLIGECRAPKVATSLLGAYLKHSDACQRVRFRHNPCSI